MTVRTDAVEGRRQLSFLFAAKPSNRQELESSLDNFRLDLADFICDSRDWRLVKLFYLNVVAKHTGSHYDFDQAARALALSVSLVKEVFDQRDVDCGYLPDIKECFKTKLEPLVKLSDSQIEIYVGLALLLTQKPLAILMSRRKLEALAEELNLPVNPACEFVASWIEASRMVNDL